jgi:hypothetical protein
MWLSTDETAVLDNALITMEHLYRTGVVHFHLRRLINEKSHFSIEYSIDKIPTSIMTTISSDENENAQDNDEQHLSTHDKGKIEFMLAMSDVDDLKRQLTFCNVDLQENMLFKKVLLNEQLILLNLVDKIHSMMIKLEMAGHPDYQLKDETLQLFNLTGSTIAKEYVRHDHRLFSR